MESNQLSRILNLIIHLTSNGRHTAQQYAEMLGTTRRNIYNYLHLLADYGFEVIKDGNYYSLDRQSAFFKHLHETIPLSDTEAEYICHMLAEAPKNDTMAARLHSKLARHFKLDDIAIDSILAQRVNDLKAVIRQAMKEERIIKIADYSSPHSHSVKDRYVEPFLFMNNGRDVRCHEIATHVNKTFKIARMGGVEILNEPWFNKHLHKKMYTDIFMFAGEERHTVSLRMGQLAHNLMIEEYPLSEPYFTAIANDNSHWTLQMDVVSFLGIGRFVLGLYDDIEVIGDEAFRQYITDKVKRMTERVSKAHALKHSVPLLPNGNGLDAQET